MKRFPKKLAALLLAAVMIVTLLPTSVFAEELPTETTETTVSVETVAETEESAELTNENAADESADPAEDVKPEADQTDDTAEKSQETADPEKVEEFQSEVTVPETKVEETQPEEPVYADNSIIKHPQDVVAAPLETAVFKVETNGNVYSYQWQYSVNGGKKWYSMYGWQSSQSSLSITASNYWWNSNNGYMYRCVVTFKDGEKKVSVTSDAATLYVGAAKSLTKNTDKTKLTVDYPAGTFPDGTTVAIEDVDSAKIAGAIDDALEEGTAAEITAVDISFKYDGEEIEPANGNKVKVVVESDAIKEGAKLFHINDFTGEAEEIAEEDIVSIKDGKAEFYSNAFSVYAIVEPGECGDEARVTVNFYGKDTDTPVATFYVKNSDVLLGDGEREDGKSYIEDIVIDPGIGEVLPSGQLFVGWYIGETADFTTTTTPVEIDDIRSYLDDLTITEGMTVNVWAMIFNVYSVTYLDEQNISRGSDTIYLLLKETTTEYTISQDYTPADPTKRFLGWQTDDDAKISNAMYEGATADEPYKMGTTMTISGSITFTVNAPKGRWLVFDENGTGATYNAPQFVKEGDVTVEPDFAKPENMIRLGYEFKGWFTEQYADNAVVDESKRFTFGDELSETTTTIYAKWDTVATANYVVIYWKQSVSGGNNYDFDRSQTVVGNVGTAINVTIQGSTVRVTGANNYTVAAGFSYYHADEGKTVAPEGNTVVNVYINRKEYTLSFRVNDYTYTVSTNDNGNRPEKYGDVNGQKARVYWNNGAFRTSNRGDGPLYTGTVYTRSNNQSWQTIKTITALYGQRIGDNFPISGYENSRWAPQNDSEWNAVMVYVDTMPARNVTFNLSNAAYSIKTMNYYVEALPEDTQNIFIYNNVRYTLLKQLSPHYNGVTVEDFVDLLGFSKVTVVNPNRQTLTPSGNPAFYWYNGSKATIVNFLYSRNKYPITFFDGIYVDGNGNRLNDYASHGQWKVVNDVVYGSSTASYNKDGADYYVPTSVYPGFVFEGWYIDDDCSQPYTFTTMPEGGIKVYAKWRQIQYRIFLHPQATLPDGTNDSSLNWGSDSQQMNFRVTYGGSLSTPTGLRDEYEFIGWFLENGSPFNMASKFTDVLVTTPYDKTAQENWTDSINGNPMNKFGEIEGAGYNSDAYSRDAATGELTARDRFWITKKLDLYGKWSAKLTGAEGIGIHYDANGGSGAPEDTRKYKDNADAIAQPASTAPSNQQFLYWVVQKWNGTAYEDTTVHVYPGDTFTVLKVNAKVTNIIGPGPGEEGYEEGVPYLAYTVQLRAEYGPASVAKDTHIEWYRNWSSDDTAETGLLHKDDNLQINQAVDIYTLAEGASIPTHSGYKFLGWARKNEKDSNGNIIPYYEVTEADLYLKWIEDEAHYELADGTVVTQVAADEALPYHALYAVWEANAFYVYHSATGELEAIDMASVTDTLDLTAKVSDGALYGGYYKASGAVIVDNVEAAKTAALAAADLTAPVTRAALYDGTSLKNGSVRFWTKDDAYTAPGNAMMPVKDTVYYLKEVPTCYLKTNAKWVYNWASDNKIEQMYFLTVIDDLYYSEVGFVVIKDRIAGKIASTFSYQGKDDAAATKIKAADLIGQRGYLGIVDAKEYINRILTKSVVIQPYWKTLDGVTVTTAGYTLSCSDSVAAALTNDNIQYEAN